MKSEVESFEGLKDCFVHDQVHVQVDVFCGGSAGCHRQIGDTRMSKEVAAIAAKKRIKNKSLCMTSIACNSKTGFEFLSKNVVPTLSIVIRDEDVFPILLQNVGLDFPKFFHRHLS